MPNRPSKQESSPAPDAAVVTANAGDTAAVEAVKPLPGASVIGRGIYIKPRRPYELKAHLFDLGQQPDQLFTSEETGQSYRVPRNCVVNNSPPTPADQSLAETVIEESWDRFGKELTLNVNAAVGSGVINIDPSAVRAESVRSEEDSYYALRSSFIALWNIAMVDVPDVSALEKEVDRLPAQPLDPASRDAYARVFGKYGSHYVKSAWVGGMASLVFVVNKSSQLTKDEVRAGVQASFAGILKGGTSSEQSSVGDRFRSSSTCKVFGSGGDRVALAKLSSLDPEIYGEWIESIKRNPQAIQLGLAGIWTLIKNPAKAEALKIAYVQESSFKPISAVIPVTMAFDAGVESRLYFLRDEDVFEYRLRWKPGERKTTRNPKFAIDLRKRLEGSPVWAKFARPDAAVSLNGFGGPLNNALYLFRHRQCLRLDVTTESIAIADHPNDIEEVLPGVDFDRIDAALAVAPEKLYLFRGPHYIRVDLRDSQPAVRPRDSIKKRWEGVTFDRLDTAVYWGNSKVYLFYGDQYIRYDMSLFRADPGYPRFIENNYVEDWELFE